MSATQVQLDRFELGVNAVAHVFLIFTALTLLFIFIISNISNTALQKEMNHAVTSNLSNVLVNSNSLSAGVLKVQMKPYDSPLALLETLTEGKDQVTIKHNEGLFGYAYFIMAIFFTTLLVMLLVMAYGANIRISPLVLRVLLLNVVIFFVVGLYEAWFFLSIGRKYVPVVPSFITKSIIETMQKAV
jgi:hypothetical protein